MDRPDFFHILGGNAQVGPGGNRHFPDEHLFTVQPPEFEKLSLFGSDGSAFLMYPGIRQGAAHPDLMRRGLAGDGLLEVAFPVQRLAACRPHAARRFPGFAFRAFPFLESLAGARFQRFAHYFHERLRVAQLVTGPGQRPVESAPVQGNPVFRRHHSPRRSNSGGRLTTANVGSSRSGSYSVRGSRCLPETMSSRRPVQ